MSKEILSQLIDEIQLGKPIQFKDLCVFPLFRETTQVYPVYLGMKTAINQKVLELREVPGGGRVSKIRATNLSALPILLLDGEAIIGAKQNRIINTSILLGPQKEVLVPVSCVERGRWRLETSSVFSDSGEIMPAGLRYSKSHQVANNIKARKGFSTDQQEIWKNVASLNSFHRIASPTQSLQETFRQKRESINKYLEAFKIQKKQTGLIVFRAGLFVGFDYVSLPSVYRDLHEKFLKSHAMEAITRHQLAQVEPPTQDEVLSLIKGLSTATPPEYDSLGLGIDYRFKGGQFSSALLIHHEQVIHWTAFPEKDTYEY